MRVLHNILIFFSLQAVFTLFDFRDDATGILTLFSELTKDEAAAQIKPKLQSRYRVLKKLKFSIT